MSTVQEPIGTSTSRPTERSLPVTCHYIDGAFADGGQRRGPVYNPATGAQQGEVLFADVATIDRAVAAAKRAFPEWRDTALGRRAKVMFAFRELVSKHADQIARDRSRSSTARCCRDAQGEVARGLEVVEFACGIPHLLKGEFSENVSAQVDSLLDPAAAWAWSPASRRSTSRRWCRCGCTRSRSPAATRSC